MPGLFVKQQAESVSQWCDVTVLYLHPDHQIKQKYEVVAADEQGVHVIRVYYRVPSSGSLFSSLQKIRSFLIAIRKGMKSMNKKPVDLVHVHVLTRQGLIALFLKLKKRIPYVITEHWSRYFKENDTYKGLFRKWITRIVVRNAAAVVAVSERLKSEMLRHGLTNARFRVIPNAVDTKRFIILKEKAFAPDSLKRIIHISCFEDKSKNISGFLRAIQQVSAARQDFTVALIGEGPDWIQCKTYASALGLPGTIVSFTGLRSHDDLVKDLNNSDFLVLSSHYETFGTVIIEAMACGIPVVSTDAGIASSVIHDENGLLIPVNDESSLKTAIEEMLDRCRSFDRLKIRDGVVSAFDINRIAEQLFTLYREALR